MFSVNVGIFIGIFFFFIKGLDNFYFRPTDVFAFSPLIPTNTYYFLIAS